MLMTKCLVLICGPPACLKSTLLQILRLILNYHPIFNLQFLCLKKLYEVLFGKKERSYKYNFLSFDDLFFGYENEIIRNESNWKSYRSLIADEIERIILSQSSNISSTNLKYSSQILNRLYQSLTNFHQENILIIEDNFYYSSMRHRYRQIAQRAHIGFVSIHLYSNLSVALERNQKREISKCVSNLSIENIYSKYELFDDSFVINTTDRGLTTEHLNRILQRIEQACHEPEQQIQVIDDEQRRIATEINQQNRIYQIDQRLRKFISNYLKTQFSQNEKFQNTNEKKFYAEMINEKRQKFLELIKYKFILLTEDESIEEKFECYLRKS